MKLHIASAVVYVTLASLTCVGLTPGAHAAAIHKCANQGSVAYQADPCGEGQTEVAVLRTPAHPSHADTTAGHTDSAGVIYGGGVSSGTAMSPQSTRVSAQWLPFRRKVIVAGMTDDEVLNTMNGGVPTRISRNRQGRSWHETWTYESPNGTVRELEFVNGRLTTSTSDREASLRLASATQQDAAPSPRER